MSASYSDYVLNGDTSKKFYPPKKDVYKALDMMEQLIAINPNFKENVLIDAIDFKSLSNVDENILGRLENLTTKMIDSQDIMQKISEARLLIQKNMPQKTPKENQNKTKPKDFQKE